MDVAPLSSTPPAPPTLAQRFIESVVFWVLMLTGVGVFAIGLLVPAWQSYAAALVREQQMTTALGRLESEVAQTRQIAHAIKTDPLINEELALSELNYRREGQVRLAVQGRPSSELDEPLNTPDELTPQDPPTTTSQTTTALAHLQARIPPDVWRLLSADESLRLKAMVLGAALVVISVVVFSRRPRPAA